MPRFAYKAKRGPKEVMEGTLEAENKNAALHKLSAMGYYPVSIAKEDIKGHSLRKTPFPFFRKVSVAELSLFTRQLADLLEAGLPLIRALSVLQRQTVSRYLQNLIADVRDSVRDGNPLSTALASHRNVFSGLYVSMVKSGEESGSLENVLLRLAEFQEAEGELTTTVHRALAYPALMAVVGAATIFVLMAFVIPKIVAMFQDLNQMLPLPTVLLLKISYFIRDFWWIIAVLCLLAYFVFQRVAKAREGKLFLDRLKLSIPVMGRLILRAEISRFARTLSTLLNNGVPILDALSIVITIMENESLKKEVKTAQQEIRGGGNLTGGLSKGVHFPLFVSNMIAVGEESGALEKALLKIAISYEKEVDKTVKILTSLLEPFMILTMGLIIGFIVIAMLLPIFEISFIAR